MAQRSVFVAFDLDATYVRAERLTIDHVKVFIVSDGSRATMREFVKEMLFYNPDFHIEVSPDGETWYLRLRREAG